MTKKNYDIIQQYREDLMQAYREVSGKCWSQGEAWRKTAAHPAPRYYVSPREVYCILLRCVKGDFSEVDAMTDTKKRMYYSLFDKLQELSQRRDMIGKSLRAMCNELVLQPAPEFFVAPRTVRYIYINYKRHGSSFRHSDIYGKKELEE